MRVLQTALVMGMIAGGTVFSDRALAQEAPEGVDSYPKQKLKERADRRDADREAAKNQAAAAFGSTGPVVPGSSPMGIDMVVINPGSGKLGSPDFEKKRARNENPYRDTQINYSFEVSKYEITFDDWAKCLSDVGAKASGLLSTLAMMMLKSLSLG